MLLLDKCIECSNSRCILLPLWSESKVSFENLALEAIPIYPVLTMAIPKACLNEIQRIQRSFIWSDSEAGRKFHAVNGCK
jgi:hypothetical protein